MPTTIDLDTLKRLIQEGAQLVETLPAAEYRKLHLPGAVNIPTETLNRETTANLDRDRPIVVYCYDTQ